MGSCIARATPNNSEVSLVQKRGHVTFDARAQFCSGHGLLNVQNLLT